MHSTLSELVRKNWLWTGFAQSSTEAAESGYIELDKKLDGGLPKQGVIDVKTLIGIGELRLLLPYLSAQERHWAFISPPAKLHGEFLQQELDLAKVLVVQPDDNIQALWCAEQCLRSGSCSSVLLWQSDLEVGQVRRLMLAAEKGEATLFLLRSQQAQQQVQFSLPVTLSMRLAPNHQGVSVAVDKRKGGRAVEPFKVNMGRRWPQLTAPALPSNVIAFEKFDRVQQVS